MLEHISPDWKDIRMEEVREPLQGKGWKKSLKTVV